MSSSDNDKLIQTRVSKAIFSKVKKMARESGTSVATYLRQLLIREVKGQEEIRATGMTDMLGEVERR